MIGSQFVVEVSMWPYKKTAGRSSVPVALTVSALALLLIAISVAYHTGQADGERRLQQFQQHQFATLDDPNGAAAAVSLLLLEKLSAGDLKAARAICTNTIVGFYRQFDSSNTVWPSPYVSNLYVKIRADAGKWPPLQEALERK
jgi:hypothetical protein